MTTLIGKFFCHMGPEYMHTGEVIAQADPTSVLVKMDHCEHVLPTMMVVSVSVMAGKLAKDGSIETQWEFFATREQMTAWLEWLETPADKSEQAATVGKLN